jgi:hypothetical protein
MKNPVTPSGIEPATLRFEAQLRTQNSNYSNEMTFAWKWPQHEQRGGADLGLVSSSLLGTFQVCKRIKDELLVATEHRTVYDFAMKEYDNRATTDGQ